MKSFCEPGIETEAEHINHRHPAGPGMKICKEVLNCVEGVMTNGDTSPESCELVLRNNLFYVVDDDKILQGVWKAMLRFMEGIEIKVFNDGREALDEIEKTGELPAVILSDYQMPNLDGLGLCMEMKKIDPSKRPMVIVATGDNAAELHDTFIDAGAYTLLQKPLRNFDDVLSIVEKAHFIRTLEN